MDVILTLVIRFLFFFFNDTATTEIYTLSLHDALPIHLVLLRSTPIRCHRAASSGSCTQTKSRSRKVGARKNRNRWYLRSDRGDNRALTSASEMRRVCASAARLGQISASTRTIRAGRMAENARRIIGQ